MDPYAIALTTNGRFDLDPQFINRLTPETYTCGDEVFVHCNSPAVDRGRSLPADYLDAGF